MLLLADTQHQQQRSEQCGRLGCWSCRLWVVTQWLRCLPPARVITCNIDKQTDMQHSALFVQHHSNKRV
jgi:hypothetical protein